MATPTATASRSNISLDVHSISAPGSAHDYEDRILVDQKRMLFAVADGVTLSRRGRGGAAADLAIKILERSFSGELAKDLMNVHMELSMARESGTAEAIGETTMTACCIAGQLLTVANVGDSPALLVREDGSISSLVQKDETSLGYLTQVIGGSETIDVHQMRMLLKRGDYVLVASDGVEHVLEPAQILPIAARRSSSRQLAETLIEKAKKNEETQPFGYDDDKSLIVIRVLAV